MFSCKQWYHLFYGTSSVVKVIHSQNRCQVQFFGRPCTYSDSLIWFYDRVKISLCVCIWLYLDLIWYEFHSDVWFFQVYCMILKLKYVEQSCCYGQCVTFYCHRNSVRLSVCLYITLAIHTKTVQDIEMGFAPTIRHDTVRILRAKFRGRRFMSFPPKQMC